MEWNVYRYDFNRRKIEKFNVFEHGRFKEDVDKCLLKNDDKESFEKELKNTLMYYYWSKSEWEIIIAPWIGDENSKVKIDVYDQVMMNWNKFVNYVWSCKK